MRPVRLCRAGLALLVFILLGLPTQAVAGQWTILGGLGGAFFDYTVTNGTWRQDEVQTPNNRLFDQAWKIGIQYRINEQYAIRGYRFDWGSSAVKSRFASDEAFYGGKCPGPDCPTAYNRVEDRMWGYALTASRYWPITEKSEWYLSAGAAGAFHELKWGDGSSFGPTRFNGAIPMGVVGGGLCYEILCLDNNFYIGTLSMNGGCLNGGQYDCGYPLAKRVFESMVVVQLPLPWGQ